MRKILTIILLIIFIISCKQNKRWESNYGNIIQINKHKGFIVTLIMSPFNDDYYFEIYNNKKEFLGEVHGCNSREAEIELDSIKGNVIYTTWIVGPEHVGIAKRSINSLLGDFKICYNEICADSYLLDKEMIFDNYEFKNNGLIEFFNDKQSIALFKINNLRFGECLSIDSITPSKSILKGGELCKNTLTTFQIRSSKPDLYKKILNEIKN